jgi:hypothetical protein
VSYLGTSSFLFNSMETLPIRNIHKIQLWVLKVIPMVLSLIVLLNIVLSYLNVDTFILSYLGGVSLLPMIFLYISSYAFKFCSYHRLFLHYVSLNWILNIYDYYIGIPLSDKKLLMFYLIITGLFIFLILYRSNKYKNILRINK